MRTLLALVALGAWGLEGHARAQAAPAAHAAPVAPVAQVDRGDAAERLPNLALPRGAIDLTPPTASEPRVPPAWRDVEREIGAAFSPAAELVSTRSPATLLSKQLLRYLSVVRALEESHGDPAITLARNPEDELRRRFEEEPAEWVRIEIEVDLDARGRLGRAASWRRPGAAISIARRCAPWKKPCRTASPRARRSCASRSTPASW